MPDISMETRVKLLEEQNSRHEARLNRHSDKLDVLEARDMKLPIEINKAITESLTPVMDSISGLVDENSKLQDELNEVKNSKYVEGYNNLKRATWGLVGLVGTYVVTMLLKMLFEK